MVPLSFCDGPQLITVSQGGQTLAVMYRVATCLYRVEFVNGWPSSYLMAECRACAKAAFRAMWLAWQFNSPSLWEGAS